MANVYETNQGKGFNPAEQHQAGTPRAGIGNCVLTLENGGDKRFLCKKASKEAQNAVEVYGRRQYPRYFTENPFDKTLRPIGVDFAIRDLINNEQIIDRGGHAVAEAETYVDIV